MDGDGCIHKKECRISLVATKDYCLSFKNYIEALLGVHCSIMLCHGKIESPVRTIQIAGRNQVKKFLDWIYQDAEIYMKRKYQVYQNVYCQSQ